MGKSTAYFLAGAASLAAIILYMLNRKQAKYIISMNGGKYANSGGNTKLNPSENIAIFTKDNLPIKKDNPFVIEDTRYRIRKTPFINFEKDFVRDYNSNVVPKQASEKVWNNYSEILSERSDKAKLNINKPIYL